MVGIGDDILHAQAFKARLIDALGGRRGGHDGKSGGLDTPVGGFGDAGPGRGEGPMMARPW